MIYVIIGAVAAFVLLLLFREYLLRPSPLLYDESWSSQNNNSSTNAATAPIIT